MSFRNRSWSSLAEDEDALGVIEVADEHADDIDVVDIFRRGERGVTLVRSRLRVRATPRGLKGLADCHLLDDDSRGDAGVLGRERTLVFEKMKCESSSSSFLALVRGEAVRRPRRLVPVVSRQAYVLLLLQSAS